MANYMTVCEARKLLENMAPNAEIWLSVDLPGYVAPRHNYRLEAVRKEGQLVFLDGAEVEQ